jgi:arylsulfatase A-like enzyme
VDHHIGRIMEALRGEGMAGDTIVLYAADHGDFVAGHGMIEKCALGHNVYEDTLRVPLIFSRPGQIREGQVCSGLAELVDLYPTLLDLAGLPRPSGYELAGRSLKSTLEKGAPTGRRAAISENWSQLTVITDRYKLGRWIEPPNAKYDYRRHGDQLFDLVKDPLEVDSLFKDPGAGEIRAGLEKTANEWSARTPARAKELSAPRALGLGGAPKSKG